MVLTSFLTALLRASRRSGWRRGDMPHRLRACAAQGRSAEGQARRGRSRPRPARSRQTSPVSRGPVSVCIASTAYDSGSTLLTTSRTRAAGPRGDEQAAQQDLRDHHRRHELHGLELGLREGARRTGRARAEHGVGDRDDRRATRPGPARRCRAAPTLRRDGERRCTAATRPKASGVADRGSRACPSASPAAVRGCRWSARAASSRWSPGTS